MKYYFYILQTVDNTLYSGITNDVIKRYKTHLEGHGAKYTKAHKPEKIVYLDILEDKSSALKEEIRVKALSRKEKLELIEKNKIKTKEIYSIIEMEQNKKGKK